MTQNSMVGDGFGGRSWYTPTNYTVGSYSAYSICFDNCDSNQLYGWGLNNYNQLGLGLSNPGSSVPQAIPKMSNVKYYSTGYLMGAIKNDNTGWAWGAAADLHPGIVGDPLQVISDVKFVDASSIAVSFVKNDGTVWNAGVNLNGAFGTGNFGDPYFFHFEPVQMKGIYSAVRVAANSRATIVLLEDGSLMSAGVEYGHGLGPSVAAAYTAMPILGLPKMVDVKSINFSTIALSEDGEIYYWGEIENSSIPTKINSLSNIVAISGCDDGAHFLALDEDKNCFAFGFNDYGQCGAGFSGSNIQPQIPLLVATDVIDIMAGESFSYIVKSDGSLWCAGMDAGISIWLNLPPVSSTSFVRLDPSLVAEACMVKGIIPHITDCGPNSIGTITIDSYGFESPLMYSIGGDFQSDSTFEYLEAGEYQISILDNQGCETSIDVTVAGENCPEPPILIQFPNVFTPNGDSDNDFFHFESEGVIELNGEVFNRWGERIAILEGIDATWDGKTVNGQECADGVYFYKVRYKDYNDEAHEQHGFLTVLR